jgi:protoporphyrinogen oxidase
MSKTVILGAGITGMAAGFKKDIPIYEASDHAGGICTSYHKDGFEFEEGGSHWIFGNNEAVDFVRTLVELNTYERKAGIYFNKTMPYPIQTTTDKDSPSTPGYFKDWIKNKFSRDICNMFFHPFNEKYTAGYYDEVIQFDAYKTPNIGNKGYCVNFHDPKEGLTSLVDALKENCNIKFNTRATQILPGKRVVFDDGEVVKYDKLISTIPLDKMLHLCGKQDYDLPYSSVLVINIGAKPGMNLPDDHWIYVPFCKSGFHRIGVYSNVDKSKAPDGMVGLCVELAYKDTDLEDINVHKVISEVVQELQSWRFIEDVVTTDPTWVKHAYTWMRTAEERERHLEWLKERGIISTGRYGKWKFQGMAESITDGMSV